MMKRVLMCLLLVSLLLPQAVFAQDDAWTCDDGPNDVLNAAQSAYDAGELDRAYELAQVAETVCGSGATMNTARYFQATQLRGQIELAMLPTPTPISNAQVLTLVNQGEAQICSVLTKPTGTRLSEFVAKTVVINIGESANLELPAGNYDVLVNDCTSRTLRAWMQVDLTQSVTLTYSDQPRPEHKLITVTNEASETICDVAINVSSDDISQVNQGITAPFVNIEPGQSREIFDLSAGSYDVILFGCSADTSLAVYPHADLSLIDSITYSPEVLSNEFFIKALTLEADGQYEEALTMLEKDFKFSAQIGDYSSVISALNYIGKIYTRLGQYPQAQEKLQLARSLAQLHELPAEEARALKRLGDLMLAQGDFGAAESYWREGITLCIAIGDISYHLSIATFLTGAYLERGQWDTAEQTWQGVLDVTTGLSDPEAVTVQAEANEGLASIEVFRGNIAQAQTYYLTAFELYESINDADGATSVLLSRCISSLIYTDLDQGSCQQVIDRTKSVNSESMMIDYVLALETLGRKALLQRQFEQAVGYCEQLQLARQSPYWTNDLASASQFALCADAATEQGQFADALVIYQEAFNFFQAIYDRDDQASILVKLGDLNRKLGRYPTAQNYYEQALHLYQEMNDLLGQAEMYRNLGDIDHDQKAYSSARENYAEALKIYESGVGLLFNRLDMLALLASTYVDEGDFDAALKEAERAEEIASTTVWDQYVVLMTYIQIYGMAEQYDEAFAAHQELMGIVRNSPGFPFPLAYVQAPIAGLYLRQSDYDSAIALLNETIPDINVSSSPDFEAMRILWMNRGVAYEMKGQLDQARADYLVAMDTNETVLSEAGFADAVLNLLNNTETTYPYRALTALLVRQDELPTAFYYAERGRGLVARLELESGIINFSEVTENSALLEQWQHLQGKVDDARRYLDYVKTNPDNLHPTEADDAIKKAENELDQAREELAAHEELMETQGELAAQINFEPRSLTEIQAALAPNTALISYSLMRRPAIQPDAPPGSAVFVITSDSIHAELLDLTDEELAPRVISLRSGTTFNAEGLQILYNQLIAPITDNLPADITRLIIVPDGVLNEVPFAALQAPDGRYLIDQYALSTAPSGTFLVMLSHRTQSAPTSNGAVFSYQFDEEARQAAQLLQVEPVMDVTEADLREGATGAAVVYISAHAQLDKFAPLFSAIELKPTGSDDGHFEVREVYNLDLTQGTELVVLSGCETAVGGTSESFGPMTRAFFTAGAPRIVASLWQVEGAATADLLTTFIAERVNYDNDADALRAAMLATREQHPEPYYWAGFVLSGLP